MSRQKEKLKEELIEKFNDIKEAYYYSAEFEGEDYKWMSLRNDSVESLFLLIEILMEKKDE